MIKSPLAINLLGLLASLLLITGCGLMHSWLVAQSVFWGGVIFLIPTLYSTYYAFRFKAANQSQKAARSFYQGEMGKIALVATGFAVIFELNKELAEAAIFIGFCLMIPAQITVAMFISKLQNH